LIRAATISRQVPTPTLERFAAKALITKFDGR
jgi:hypothetical protein